MMMTFFSQNKEPFYTINQQIYDNNFVQLQKIGQGGFASVYRVVHKIDDTEYAVKQIHLKIKDVKDDLQKHYEKLIREAKYLAQVNHPNVIRYFHSWIEVTEKKKSQKQEEQKRQALELSSFTSNNNKNSNANNTPMNGVVQAKESGVDAQKDHLQRKVSPPKGKEEVSHHQQKQQQHLIQIKKIGYDSSNADPKNKQQGVTSNDQSNKGVANQTNNNQNGEQKNSQQKGKNNGQQQNSNNDNKNKQQQQQMNQQSQNQSHSDDDGNEDSHTFYFEDEYDNEVVFIEENSKSNNKDESQQDISTSSANNLNQSTNAPNSNSQQDILADQSTPNHANSTNNNNNQSNISTNININNNNNNNNINNSNIKANRNSQMRLFNNSNGNSSEIPNKKLSQDSKKQPEFSLFKGNYNEAGQENNSQSFNKNQSDFQLVFESSDNSKSERKDLEECGNKKEKGNMRNEVDKNKQKGFRENESKQKGGKQERNVIQQEQEQQNNQQQQPMLSMNNTKSYERRKNKSMDYLTIGQKQREFQLDKYDEIIFYLQTELCSQTLAEYITNRNKKLFTMQSMTQVQQGMKNNNKNNSVSSPQINLVEPNHSFTNQTNHNNNNMNGNNLGSLALNYSYSSSSDPYDILTPEFKHQAILILKEIIKGLYHIHHICKMVHRDLKPHNIFLTENMQVKIGDFGLVKKLSKLINPNQKVQYNDHQLYGKKHGNDNSAMKYTSTNNSFSAASTSPSETNSGYHDKLPFYLPKEEITSTCGTATYASPEQLSQKAEFFDHRADIYSLGIIILQLFHPMNTTMELVKTIQNCKKGELPKNFCSRFPRLSEIIKDSLSNDPQKRPLLSKIEQTLQEMEIMESQFHSEVLGKLMVTFEQEPSQVIKFCKIIRNSLYFYKHENSGKAENVYNIQECTVKQITGQHEIIEDIAISHPIQQNFTIRAYNSEKTLALFSFLQKYQIF